MVELKRNPRKKDKIYRILIVGPNWLGDIMFTTPAIRAVRKAFPEAYISCWVVPRVADVLRANPNVDELLLFDERKWFQVLGKTMNFVMELYNRCFDLGILFHRSFTRSAILKMAKIPTIVGQYTRKRARLGMQTVDLDYDSMHRVDYYLSIVASLGIRPDGYHYDFRVEEESRNYVRHLLEYWGIRKDFALLLPGANWERKRWPAERFSELADRIVGELGWDVVLSGGAGDVFLCEQIVEMSRFKERIFVSAGKTTINQFGALAELAKVVVGNDTGPVHIASAVNRRVYAIFGPTSPSVTGLYGDLRDNNIFVPSGCKVPCRLEECIADLKCIKSVDVDLVMSYITARVGD